MALAGSVHWAELYAIIVMILIRWQDQFFFSSGAELYAVWLDGGVRVQ